MFIVKIIILAIVQGIAELLPVSSSAHVIVAEKLMGLDPVSPEMTLLLVMLHTGTMFAVIAYFWQTWRYRYFSSRGAFIRIFQTVVIATVATGLLGFALKALIERLFLGGDKAQIEELFGNTLVIACGLLCAGILIIVSGKRTASNEGRQVIGLGDAGLIGLVQGLCLPFRGFSRSGATISTGLLRGIHQQRIEEFSFALAVVLTPAVVGREVLRLLHAHSDHGASASLGSAMIPSLIGMVAAFLAGLLALRWLSQWLEKGRWHLFGYYCIVASAVVFALHYAGY